MRVRGGQNIFGHSVGILMLDTQFPRIPGDMGNAATFDFPVLYHRVRGASPDRVVRHGQRELLPAFIAGARVLQRDGVLPVVADRRMLAANPEIGALVLECTNMPPYRADLQLATGLPVFDITTLVRMVHDAVSEGLPPRPA